MKIVFSTLALLSVVFVVNSYPFMYPAFDMWWHMAWIELANEYNVNDIRVWHRLWSEIFEIIKIEDFFEKSLIIHRVQFIVTFASVWAAGYLILRTVFIGASLRRIDLVVNSWFGVVIWLIINGSISMSRGGPGYSVTTQSWISWYSINYQITLPIYLLSTAGLLYLVAVPARNVVKIGLAISVAVGVVMIALIHSAEIPYFILASIFIWILYARGRAGLYATLIASTLTVAGIYIGLKYSPKYPEFLRYTLNGDWIGLLEKIQLYSQWLVHEDGNRAQTSWNTGTSISFTFAVITLGISMFNRQLLSVKPILFVIMTSLMPMMIFHETSAGLLAMVTHLEIVWRFSFASFLFIAIPMFFTTLGLILYQKRFKVLTPLIISITITMLVVHSIWCDPKRIVFSYAKSIYNSLDPRRVYFGLSDEERKALIGIQKRLKEQNISEPLCVDSFTAYYLYFIMKYRNVYLTNNFDVLPNDVYQPGKCSLSAENNDLKKLGLDLIQWRYDIRPHW